MCIDPILKYNLVIIMAVLGYFRLKYKWNIGQYNTPVFQISHDLTIFQYSSRLVMLVVIIIEDSSMNVRSRNAKGQDDFTEAEVIDIDTKQL